MNALIQRVSQASVTIDGNKVAQIGRGLCVFVGFKDDDSKKDLDYFVRKLPALRLFSEGSAKFNKNVADIGGEILLVPQFTLYGTIRKGTKPEFSKSMNPEMAEEMFNQFFKDMSAAFSQTQKGVFRAYMQVELINDGPVTFNLSSDHL